MDNKTKRALLDEIDKALGNVDTLNFGSIELIFQDNRVTQISVRNIKKTSIDFKKEEPELQQVNKTFKIHAHFRRTE